MRSPGPVLADLPKKWYGHRAQVNPATVTTAAFFRFIIAAGLRAQRRRVTTGAQGLVGRIAVATVRLAPGGRVRLGNEYWNAVSRISLEPGRKWRSRAWTG